MVPPNGQPWPSSPPCKGMKIFQQCRLHSVGHLGEIGGIFGNDFGMHLHQLIGRGITYSSVVRSRRRFK